MWHAHSCKSCKGDVKVNISNVKGKLQIAAKWFNFLITFVLTNMPLTDILYYNTFVCMVVYNIKACHTQELPEQVVTVMLQWFSMHSVAKLTNAIKAAMAANVWNKYIAIFAYYIIYCNSSLLLKESALLQ